VKFILALTFVQVHWQLIILVFPPTENVPFSSLFQKIINIIFLTLQYCIGFAIYQHESARGIHNLFY